jgi:hypothetical protein
MLEKHQHTVSSLRASPFWPRSISLCLVGHRPIRSKAAYSSGRGLNESLTFLRARLHGSPLGSQERKAGAIRQPAHRHDGVKEQGHCRLGTVPWRLKNSGYAYLPGSNGEKRC